MATDITTIKKWFKTGLKPTQAQFWATWDSYWHKDEKISISAINNLENVLNNKADNTHEHTQYATNDATSLTEANIISWQKTLKISDLKFDDKAITTTQDYSDFGLQAGATINSFNNAIYQTVRNKLDTPTEEGTTENYPYVVGVNEDNESVKLPAGDLGKNFANTNLVVTENRKHTGTATVEFGMPLVFSNAVQQFKNLADKSSDATFNALLGLDSNGNIGKLGLLAMTNVMSKSTDAQKDAWRKAQLKTTEGYSTGRPVIYSVTPLVDRSLPYAQYITLSGLNLYINNVDIGTAKIYMIDSVTNEKTLIENFSSYSTQPDKITFGYNFNLFTENKTFYFQVEHNNLQSVLDKNVKLEVLTIEKTEPTNYLNWSVINESNRSLENTNTSSNTKGNIVSSLYEQTPILTKEELIKGVILIFNLSITSRIDYSDILFGFTTNPTIDKGLSFLTSISINGNSVTSSPSNNKNSTVYTSMSSRGLDSIYQDTLYVTIDKGISSFLFQSKGVRFVENFTIIEDLYLKLLSNQKRIDTSLDVGNFYINLSKKIYLT